MSTAGKATYHCARGGSGRGEKDLSALTTNYSSRDLPSHTKLKYRQPGQGTVEELRNRDFRQDLEKLEQDKQKSASSRRMIEAPSEVADPKRQKVEAVRNLDADDRDLKEDEDSDSDSEDDTEALLAELNKIKEERATEKARKELKKREEEETLRTNMILGGNPLINFSGSATNRDTRIKKSWNDDVVFKNCGRSEPNKNTGFINDSLRSDFHKKFMDKYIK